MRYIERDQWGAISSGKPLKPFRRRPVGVVIHHTTGPAEEPWRRVRAHDRYHVESRGWDSIAYNWLASGVTGEIFEGRGWHKGAATRGQNYKTISVALIGDSDVHLTHTGKEAILSIVGAARKQYGDHLWVKCHQDFSATTCPGDALLAWTREGMRMDDAPSTNAVPDWEGILAHILAEGSKNTPLKRGSKGVWVTLAQKRLNDRGASLVVDGVYGRKSVAACKQFQSQFAMKANGVIDSKTWKVLWTA